MGTFERGNQSLNLEDKAKWNEELIVVLLNIKRVREESCEDEFSGQREVYFEGGHVHKGMFSKGLMDGWGIFTHLNGLTYEGEFVRNIPTGRGKFTWPDGSTYSGGIVDGVRHGFGTHTCAKTGVSYTGEWSRGKRHGEGTVYYNESKTSWYTGDWVMNNREGRGERCYVSGNTYSGEWKCNVRHGEGTMKWLKLGQQYVGNWCEGLQHGKGTHVWIQKREGGLQYFQNNQYHGDFLHGQRHGHGVFYYAGGAIYEGEWKNNKKHGQGKLTSKNGHVFKGEFKDDKMMTPDLSGIRSPSLSGLDRILNIECLLRKIPQRKQDTECKQVEFVMLQRDSQLRSIYSFYSRLGHSDWPHNTFLLSRLQFWCLLKDCSIHNRGITLTQINRLIPGNTGPEIHSPFTSMLFHELLSSLIIIAFHIYSKDMKSQKNLLASCFSKLVTDDILPNATKVKGFLFREPDFAAAAVTYVKECWEVFQVFCRVNTAHGEDKTMTCRQLLWMFKDLNFLDHHLTTGKLWEMITAGYQGDPENLTSCVDLEVTFLEFLEVLLGCAQAKCPVSDALEESRGRFSSDSRARSEQSEADALQTDEQTPSKHSQTMEDSTQFVMSQLIKSGDETLQQTEATEEDGLILQTSQHKFEMLHRFFNHLFFPAFNCYLSVTRKTKNKLANEKKKTERHEE
uniref:Radial spoke head 10 homolog B n=1 Tax=Oryzias latipes TaxID=8090 RepID=A0A3P9IHI0_ORYLA